MNTIVVHLVIMLIVAIASVGCFYFVIHKPKIKKLKELSQAWLMEAMAPEAQNEIKYLMQIREFFIFKLDGKSSRFFRKSQTYLLGILRKDINRVHHLYFEYYSYSQPTGIGEVLVSVFGIFREEIQQLFAKEFKTVKGTDKEDAFIKKIHSQLFEQCDLAKYLLVEKKPA